MKIINTDNNSPFRAPNVYETAYISRWFVAQDNAQIKFNKGLSAFFSITGVCLSGLVPAAEGESIVILILCAFACFLGVFFSIKSKKDFYSLSKDICSGKFLLINGTVQKIESGAEKANCVRIWVLSDDMRFNDGWFRVRYEDIRTGIPVILVCYEFKGKQKYRALTPFMLSDKGINASV